MIVLETRWQVSSFLYSRVESINIKGLKVSLGVLAQQNLESVHMNFKFKQVDTSISLDSKEFAPGARLI
jgi:hypothetical protein